MVSQDGRLYIEISPRICLPLNCPFAPVDLPLSMKDVGISIYDDLPLPLPLLLRLLALLLLFSPLRLMAALLPPRRRAIAMKCLTPAL